jgi:hypothetical protein
MGVGTTIGRRDGNRGVGNDNLVAAGAGRWPEYLFKSAFAALGSAATKTEYFALRFLRRRKKSPLIAERAFEQGENLLARTNALLIVLEAGLEVNL